MWYDPANNMSYSSMPERIRLEDGSSVTMPDITVEMLVSLGWQWSNDSSLAAGVEPLPPLPPPW
jgi:hypothetical protein